jgi:hypothetical protein
VPIMTTDQNKALADVLATVSRARAVGVTENHIIRAIYGCRPVDAGSFLADPTSVFIRPALVDQTVVLGGIQESSASS